MVTTPPERGLLSVEHLVKRFPIEGSVKVVHACEDITFAVGAGETIGIIGESGSGKTTLGRCLLRLVEPTSGSIVLDGTDINALSARDLRRFRSRMHIVFQEPAMSMNPQLTVGYQITEPLRIHSRLRRNARRIRARELLEQVGLSPGFADAHPAALSGGELQRCCIARALAANPNLIVLDEPTSSLPPATRMEIIELLQRLQRERGLTYVFISHDLSLVKAICDRIAVMYLGHIVELGTRDEIFERPQHPYTMALLTSVLSINPADRGNPLRQREQLRGEIPSPIDLPPGCHLASRCPHSKPRCREVPQQLHQLAGGRRTACRRVAEGELQLEPAPVHLPPPAVAEL